MRAKQHTLVLLLRGQRLIYLRVICLRRCRTMGRHQFTLQVESLLTRLWGDQHTTSQQTEAQRHLKSSPIKTRSRGAPGTTTEEKEAVLWPDTSQTASPTSCEMVSNKQPETETATTFHRASSTSKTLDHTSHRQVADELKNKKEQIVKLQGIL